MARTLRGNCTGRAGAMEAADFRAMIFDAQMKKIDEMRDNFTDVRDALKFLDPEGWSKWYDEHVPDWLGQPAIDVMLARVRELFDERKQFDGRSEAEVDRLHEIVEGLRVEHVSLLDERQAEAMAGCHL